MKTGIIKNWNQICPEGLYNVNNKCVDQYSCKYIQNRYVNKYSQACVSSCGEKAIIKNECLNKCPNNQEIQTDSSAKNNGECWMKTCPTDFKEVQS